MTALDMPSSIASASTLEIDYLRPVLDCLPSESKTALDVGAHKGDFTKALADLGYKVLAVEPQDYMADRFAARHAERMRSGAVTLCRTAVSDHAGEADLIIGSASTVSTLEPRWTTVAFPEEFRSRRQVRVLLWTLADLIVEHELGPVGFAKIDVEGHELPVLRGLFQPGANRPTVVMFEANSRFAEQALDCLKLLQAEGYNTFDIIIRIGLDPVAGERFTEAQLPRAWSACAQRYFYANVIAYHQSLSAEVALPDPVRFVRDYQLQIARNLLQQALKDEAQRPIPVHPVWHTARMRLRSYLLDEPWHDFLRNPVCKEMFVRGSWKAGQDRELESISRSAFGREILTHLRDPDVGSPRTSEQLPGVSTNMLGMAWYLTRIHQQAQGELPQQIVEVGGGYGALAYAYARCAPQAKYVIVDLPEMLAIQYYFLTLALPDRNITFASPGKCAEPGPGEIMLVPISMLDEIALKAEQLISTFALSEMPRDLQRHIESRGYFGAKRIFITGQLSTEFPTMGLVSHGEVTGAAMQRFPRLQVERFHIGDNYLLLGERDQEEAA